MKYILYILACAFVMTLTVYGSIYILSERALGDVSDVATFDMPIPTDADSIARGQRIARTRGCFGCHGQDMSGRVFTDQWDWVERAVAPNLTTYVREHSPATIERAVRHGIDHQGRATWSMPSYNWVHLSDDQMTDIIAFLLSVEETPSNLPRPKLGWSARWAIATGQAPHMAEMALKVPPLMLGAEDEPVLITGERLAMTMCNECHGLDLRGSDILGPPAPDLAMIAAYPLKDFTLLMRECVAMGNRPLKGLMGLVCDDRFYALTDEEIRSLHLFLTSLSEIPPSTDVSWRL